MLLSMGNTDTVSTNVDSLLLLADNDESEFRHKEFTSDNRDYTITKTVSGYNGWNYYLIQPSAYLLNDLSAYRMTYLIAIAVVLILSFLIILSLSHVNTKPYEQMHNRLESSHHENVILQKKNDTLQDTLVKQRPLVYSAYVARIMKGAVSTDADVQEINDLLKIKGLGNLHFHVLFVSLRLEQPDSLNRFLLQEYETLLYKNFYQLFGNDILIYHPDVNTFALLLSDSSDTNSPECIAKIRNTFSELHTYLLKEHSLWTFAGLGDSNTKLPYFWKSYQQALEAANLLKADQFFQSYHELTRSSETYYYPNEMAQQLVSFIKNSNEIQINEIFQLILRENVTYRSISETNMQWLLSDLRTTLIKLRQSLHNTSCLPADFDNALTTETTIDGMQQLADILSKCFLSENNGNQSIPSIQKYISNNYHDPNLSLKKISEVFSISESYFSYLFKAQTGRNFSEYLEELRMQHAMQLLKESEIPLSELYIHLGYNNPNSFRRAFKKVYGSSPKEFRKP